MFQFVALRGETVYSYGVGKPGIVPKAASELVLSKFWTLSRRGEPSAFVTGVFDIFLKNSNQI